MHPEVFPGVRKVEAEVVAMVAYMFHAGPQTGGTLTSGGAESIIMSCRAHREWGRAVKGITNPEMICPISVHQAFNKAADYFETKMITVPIDLSSCTIPRRCVGSRNLPGRTGPVESIHPPQPLGPDLALWSQGAGRP
ncbi:hypothetical protein BGZ97_012206 [Linnemannia gamsii]|jgi:sphinganine-1-phosphate aldolase|uniref:Glutamate decarboxylase n=1 Tax=Linnemannia gamsii TaxID=64522 RepID=A0A9P6ULV0_9FUNG|nr:hypothetical protein BGZ97_012206 [Linnemannia gamsii]